MIRKYIVVVLFLMIPSGVGAQEQIVQFYSFEGGNLGQNPRTSGLLSMRENIYGTTYSGGLHGAGTFYKIKQDGGDYQVLHHFTGNTGAVPNGRPRGCLLYDGESIFGVCSYYSGTYGGIVYSIKPDGTGFEILADFNDGTTNFTYGKFPSYGGLILVNGVLYGSTSSGGTGHGVLFSLNRDGSNFNAFHKFASDTSEGAGCYSGLVYKGGRLYGATANGGDSDDGTIFTVKPDGTDFRVLKHLVGSTDGDTIMSPIRLGGNTLYMTPTEGGVNNDGTIISIRTDGTDFKVLHSFNTTDGDQPGVYGGLIKINAYLYGATKIGGANSKGTFYRIKIDGSGFEVLDDFDKGANYKGMSYHAPYLYGCSYSGGASDYGNLWKYYAGYPTPIPTLSEWGMIIFSLVLGIIAFFGIRNKTHMGCA